MDDQMIEQAVAEGPADIAERLDDLRSDLHSAIAEVRDELSAANERAAARERLIERLHDENQRLRAGERQMVLRPVLVDLQRIRTELLQAAADTAVPGELLISFAHSVAQALERGGVLVVRPAAGEVFDPAQHRAADVMQSDDAEDGTIAEVLSDGYRDVVADRMLAPAAVVVFRRPPVVPD